MNTNHPKIDNCTDKLPPNPIATSKQCAGCITDKMAKLKKVLKQPSVMTNQILTRHFCQRYVTLIVHHATILEELKHKH